MHYIITGLLFVIRRSYPTRILFDDSILFDTHTIADKKEDTAESDGGKRINLLMIPVAMITLSYLWETDMLPLFLHLY